MGNKLNYFLALVNLEDGSLQFLNQTLHDAEMAISVWHPDEQESEEQQLVVDERPLEYLLVFQKLGIYVDSHGFFFISKT
jgi:hypothetical protein